MALISRVTVWVSGQKLTASDLNGEFNNVLNNLTPTNLASLGNDVSALQSVSDPGEVGTENIPSTIADEIKFLRNMVKEITTKTQWYETPARTLADGQGDTAYLAALAVTRAKQEAVGEQISSSSGSFSSTSSPFVDVTNLTVTITTTGRPVRLLLQSDGVSAGEVEQQGGGVLVLKILRDSTDISFTVLASTTGNPRIPCTSFAHLDTPVAGTYTYKVQTSTSGTVRVVNTVLVAYEL